MVKNQHGRLGTHRSAWQRFFLGPNERPWFSWITGGAMLAVLIYELIRNSALTGSVISTSPMFNPMIGPSSSVLINVGAKFTPCMRTIPEMTPSSTLSDCYTSTSTCTVEQVCGFGGFGGKAPNQSFRFFTPIFLHAGIVHYIINMLTHLGLGADLEKGMGIPRYTALYLLAGLFGNVLSSMLGRYNSPSMGCSGALFGLIGYMFIDTLAHWKLIDNPGREILKLLVSTIISLILGLLPGCKKFLTKNIFVGLDNFAHLGGFVVGLVAGVILCPMPMLSKKSMWVKWVARLSATVVLVVLFVVCINVFYNSADPSQICPGCKYLSCLPVSNWCDF
ncbi:rhomboid-domain-containing protein [Hesseltinella vesiculosa]|uniref:Rhomboid-type serine protease n=1 Tax=Hesseltinella vesiculosa TaxID=101127 RepID=A0A1X2G312_9FUNG|nr:rhomboid-domain-containing protein [Hesseltinella vesiculosa]